MSSINSSLTQSPNSQINTSGEDLSKRLKGVTIVKPIVYGNVAKYFGKKRESDGHTHEWKVYIKSYYKEDISKYIKKVSFKLHESYPNNLRILNSPPFEISETGWGEFELVIKIYFPDPNERPVTLYHLLKLFKTKDGSCDSTASLLYNEYYEEIIFNEPSILMSNILNNTIIIPTTSQQQDKDENKQKINLDNNLKSIENHAVNFEEEKIQTYKQIVNAKNKIQNDIKFYKNKLNTARNIMLTLKQNINKAKQMRDAGQHV